MSLRKVELMLSNSLRASVTSGWLVDFRQVPFGETTEKENLP